MCYMHGSCTGGKSLLYGSKDFRLFPVSVVLWLFSINIFRKKISIEVVVFEHLDFLDPNLILM